MARKQKKLNFIQRLSLLAFDNYKRASVLFAVLVVSGLLAYTVLLQREGFPAIQTPISLAGGVYLVDDQEKIDQEVLAPVVENLVDNAKVESVQGAARDNTFSLFAAFEESVGSQEGADIVTAAFESANLPDGVEYQVPVIDVSKFMNEYTILLSVYAPGDQPISLEETQQLADQVAAEFEAIENTTSAEVLEAFTEGIDPSTGQSRTIQTGFSRFGELKDGEIELFPSILIGLKVSEDADTLDYSAEVSEKIDELAASSEYNGARVAISADNAPSVLTQIASLEGNLLTGLLAVSFVSFLLITWRASIITAIFMVSVVFVSLLALFVIGYSLNTITLFSLVLALGLFVDDATIIVEALDASKAKKLKAGEAIKEAIGKVGAASFAGTFTTILVFLPMAFISGILGSFIRIMPITIIIALITSLVLSLTLIPVLASFILLNTEKKSYSPLGQTVAYLAGKLSALPLIFRKSRVKGAVLSVVMIGVSVVFIGFAMDYAQRVAFNIFPPSKDSDLIGLNIDYAPGVNIEEAEQIAAEIDTRLIESVDEGIIEFVAYSVISQTGDLSNEREANALIMLKPFTERDIKSPEITTKFEAAVANIEGVRISFSQLDAGPPVEEFPFKVQIFTEDPANALGLAQEVQVFLEGSQVERVNGTTANIRSTTISNFDSIVREDGKRLFQVAAGFDADDTTALVQSAQEKVEAEFGNTELAAYGLTTEDLTFDFGQESENQESFESMGLVGMLSLVAMYILLGVQFRSLIEPLLIFMAIPFSLLGVFAGLYYTDNALSFFVMIGLFGLIGIAVNNTILLTDYVNQERREGKGAVEAVSEATRKRFRPLLTTSITTVVALMPLALSDPFWEPLAYTIIFGLLSSTFLVLVSFPYYYLAVEWLRRGVRRAFRRA